MSSQAPGFVFPGLFDLCAMGAADAGLEQLVPELLATTGLSVEPRSLQVRPSLHLVESWGLSVVLRQADPLEG